MMSEITNAMADKFLAPFDSVKWKPQVTTKGRNKQPIIKNNQQVAGCTAHIDARNVMNRLDDVVGVANWQDSYTVLSNGRNVECTLTVYGVSKSDVGEPNEGGFADAMKGAYSDALKRAAVKFGIGRYLYKMEMKWLPYDGYKVLDKPVTTTQKPDITKKPSKKQMSAFHAVGTEKYGDAWDDKRPEIVKAVTKGRATSSTHLTLDEWKTLMDGMNQKDVNDG